MNWMTRALPLVLAAVLTAAVPGHAQEGHATHHPDTVRQGAPEPGARQSMMAEKGMMGDMQGEGGMMSGGMMHAMMAPGPSPGMLLRQREALGIDDVQAERLEALQQEMAGECESRMEASRSAHEKAEAALGEDDPDFGAYESALRGMADQHVQMMVARARTARQALAILTPEQRSKLEETKASMHDGMMEGHGEGMRMMDGHDGGMSMMDGCPMMGAIGPHEKKSDEGGRHGHGTAGAR
jgi:protein CpxP